MNPTDMALLSVIGHGGISELRKNNFSWEWIEPGDAQTVIKEAMTLDLQGQPVNIANVMLRIQVCDWEPVLRAWTDGYGSTAAEAVLKSKQDYLRRNVGRWMAETSALLTKRPTEVQRWWPEKVEEAKRLSQNGTLYSPKPSSHASKPIPEIFLPFSIQTLNALFRGGIWKPGLFGISSLSGGGKTTAAITIAADCSGQGVKNAIISSEQPEQYYVYRVMRAYGFSKSEFQLFCKQDDGSERATLFHKYLSTLDMTLSVYGSEFMESGKIGSILAIERPDVLQIDHLLAMRLTSKRSNDSLAMGDMIYALQDLSNRFSCMVIVYGQLSSADATEFQSKHNLPFVKFFGSAIVNQALRWAALTCRHWAKPDEQYFLVKKNSIEETGLVETEHTMRFNSDTATYVDKGVTE
jgi:hypothetical protein